LVGGSCRRPENGEQISESGGDISKPTSKSKKKVIRLQSVAKKGGQKHSPQPAPTLLLHLHDALFVN